MREGVLAEQIKPRPASITQGMLPVWTIDGDIYPQFTTNDNACSNKNYRTIPLFVSGRYHPFNKKYSPYLSVQWGYFFDRSKDPEIHFLNESEKIDTKEISSGENNKAVVIGYGILIPVGEKHNLDISIHYTDMAFSSNHFRLSTGYKFQL